MMMQKRVKVASLRASAGVLKPDLLIVEVLRVIIDFVFGVSAAGLSRLRIEEYLHVREGLEKLGILSQLLLDEGLPVDLALVKGLQNVGTRKHTAPAHLRGR